MGSGPRIAKFFRRLRRDRQLAGGMLVNYQNTRLGFRTVSVRLLIIVPGKEIPGGIADPPVQL